MAVDVYLVPGFFGFANLGDLRYFGHVQTRVAAILGRRGVDARVHEVPTPPTAGLSRRAARLAEHVEATRRPEAELYFFGHSSGGLDVRMLLSPGVALPSRVDLAGIVGQTRGVVTAATPHRGAPLARVLVGAQGQRLVELMSLAAMSVIRRGSVPLEVLTTLSRDFAGPAVPAGLPEQLYHELLGAFTPERQRHVDALLREVVDDPALLYQLGPEPMAVFDALATLPPGVRSGSIVTAARPPGLGSHIDARMSPGRHASRILYGRLHKLAARFPNDRRPELTPAWRSALAAGGEVFLDPEANDGMVPTLSQPWGDRVAPVVADHLDVIGHFDDPSADPPHHDWVFTGSGMTRGRFAEIYDAVVGMWMG